MKTVYLAGPISELGYGHATDWRDEAIRELTSRGIRALNPMRFKTFLANEKNLSQEHQAHTKHPLATSRGIMRRDFFDVQTADVLLVNLLPCEHSKVPTLGTVMEIGWAYMMHKPVIVVAKEGDVHVRHPMISEAITYLVPTLEEGLRYVEYVLGDVGEAA